MSDNGLSKEQRILRVLRKTLGNIVKDAAPRPGRPNPLSDDTIRDIRDLFGLIAEREAELAEQTGFDRNERPHFTDQPQKSKVVQLHIPGRDKKRDNE